MDQKYHSNNNNNSVVHDPPKIQQTGSNRVTQVLAVLTPTGGRHDHMLSSYGSGASCTLYRLKGRKCEEIIRKVLINFNCTAQCYDRTHIYLRLVRAFMRYVICAPHHHRAPKKTTLKMCIQNARLALPVNYGVGNTIVHKVSLNVFGPFLSRKYLFAVVGAHSVHFAHSHARPQ